MMFKTILFSTLLVFSSTVTSAPVYHGTSTLFEDNAITLHLDNDNDGLFSAGDSILAVLEIDTTQSGQAGGFSTPVPAELTGIVDAYIMEVSAPNQFGRVNMIFAPNPGGFLSGVTDPNLADEVIQAQSGGAGLLGGEVVRFFDGPPNDLDLSSVNCLTAEDCLDLATNGQFYFSFGDKGDENFNFSLQNGVLDPAVLQTIGQATSTGFGNFNMELIDNESGENFVPRDCLPSFCNPGDDNAIHMTGSATFFGGLDLPGDALNRGDIQFLLSRPVQVSEPAPLGLMALGLLGLGFTVRRRNDLSKITYLHERS